MMEEKFTRNMKIKILNVGYVIHGENKALHGGQNLDFVYELLDDTHIIVESYLQEGYLICFPVSTEEDKVRNYVVGA